MSVTPCLCFYCHHLNNNNKKSQFAAVLWLSFFALSIAAEPFSTGHPEKGHATLIFMAWPWPRVRQRKSIKNSSDVPLYLSLVFTDSFPFTREVSLSWDAQLPLTLHSIEWSFVPKSITCPIPCPAYMGHSQFCFNLNNETTLSESRWELEGRPESFYGHSVTVSIFINCENNPQVGWASPENRV